VAEYRRSLKRPASAGFLCFLMILLGGCPFGLGWPVSLDADDNGGEVTLQVGTVLSVSLSSNPSTGFEWELVDLDSSVVEHTGTSHRSGCLIPMPGCGGTDTWMFTVLSPGITTLRMIYHRPWEDVEPGRIFEVMVSVSE